LIRPRSDNARQAKQRQMAQTGAVPLWKITIAAMTTNANTIKLSIFDLANSETISETICIK
jgi:hypothetical protein